MSSDKIELIRVPAWCAINIGHLSKEQRELLFAHLNEAQQALLAYEMFGQEEEMRARTVQ